MNDTGKNRPFRAVMKVMLAAAACISGAAFAQDTVQQTPAELRDFKLDPEKPKPAAKPLPQETPQIAPAKESAPPPVRSSAETPRVAAPTRPAITLPDVTLAAPRRAVPAPVTRSPAPATGPSASPSAPKPTSVTPASDAAAEPGFSSVPPVAGEAQAGASPIIAPQTGEATPTDAVTTPNNAQDIASASAPILPFPWWWLAAGIAAIGGLTLLFLRRRSSAAVIDVYQHADTPSFAPQTDDISAPTLPLQSTPAPAPAPISAPTVAPALRASAEPKQSDKEPDLDIGFFPEMATVSLAKLTIKGKMRIVNNGHADAKSMQLRAAIISANANQDQQIAAFYGDAQVPSNAIGTAKIGEQIVMDIDLTIPLSELSSFSLGTKQLFAPIVVANVDYGWGDDAENARDRKKLTCLIGREATPPKPKMGPLRLDLGPRSFAPLGQRPLFG